MQRKLESNIWKYALILITNKRVFVAIIGSYYLTIPNVTPWWVGFFMFVGSLASFLFEVPSGYVSDKIGHKNGLILSKVLLVLSSAFLLFAGNIFLAATGTVLWSIGFAFISGTGSAFLFETLKALGKEKKYTHISGKVSSIGFAVPVIFMVSVPFLVSINFTLPFLVALITDSIGLIAALLLVKPPVSQKQIEEIGVTNFKQVMRTGYKLKFFRYALFFGILGGILTGAGAFRAPYQELVGIPIIYLGLLLGIGRIAASLLLAYSGTLRNLFKNLRNLATSSFIIFLFLIFGLGSFHAWWAIAAIFIVSNALYWGSLQIRDGFLLDIIHKNNFKATLLSVVGQLYSFFAAFAGLGVGFAIELFSYQTAFLILGLLFPILLLLPYIFILKDPRSRIMRV